MAGEPMPFSAAVVAMRPRVIEWGERGGELPAGDFDLLYAAGLVGVAAERLERCGWGDAGVADLVRALPPRQGAALLGWLAELVPMPRRAGPAARTSSRPGPPTGPDEAPLYAAAVDIAKRLLLVEAQPD